MFVVVSWLLFGIAASRLEDCSGRFEVIDNWEGGCNVEMDIVIKKGTTAWILGLISREPLTLANFWAGEVGWKGTKEITVRSYDWAGKQSPGSVFSTGFVLNYNPAIKSYKDAIKKITLTLKYTDRTSQKCRIVLDDKPSPKPTPKPDPKPNPTPIPTDEPEPGPNPTEEPTVKPNSPCDKYKRALELSLLFYEAQRSGKLPPNQRVKWRKDSALNDEIVGGYYDAGDYVKFGFPMAAATTMVAWGAVDFKSSYQRAGQWANVKAMIKWATDYFIEAHTSKYELVGQIGLGDVDHAYWGRPEEMTMRRPSSRISASKPGSDLAAETAAALAAASIVFKGDQANPEYSAKCLRHAKELYEFAEKYKGKYSDSIPDAAKFYKSWSGYQDEMAWGAAWLHRATGENSYRTKAMEITSTLGSAGEISWDNKVEAVKILLAITTERQEYRDAARGFCQRILNCDTCKTNDGLVFIQPWGSLRHASNVAFACLAADAAGVTSIPYASAKHQINYILGENTRKFSYVVGLGSRYPTQPHHASSSCPTVGPCNWDNYRSTKPNPQVLRGALVGGPKSRDDNDYVDVRSDYVTNEVTTDYNAGFQSALAALLSTCK